MSSGNGPGDGNNTDMRRPASPDLYGGSPKKEHKDGVSDAKKRKIEDTEDGEAHEEACLFSAKRHRLQVDVKQGSAQPEQKGASSKEKDNTQEQGVDEMDIDDNKKEGGLDSEL